MTRCLQLVIIYIITYISREIVIAVLCKKLLRVCSEENLQESLLFFHYVCPRGWIQVVSLGYKWLLSCLISPPALFLMKKGKNISNIKSRCLLIKQWYISVGEYYVGTKNNEKDLKQYKKLYTQWSILCMQNITHILACNPITLCVYIQRKVRNGSRKESSGAFFVFYMVYVLAPFENLAMR